MTTPAMVTVITALFLPGALYLLVALRARRQITSIFEYLPLHRFLPADSVGATVVAAGMSMATVMVALLNLAPLMGAALFVTVITYSLGFLLLSFCVDRLSRTNPNNLILQAFLGEAYSSQAVRVGATLFTVIGYLSIFSMEILVSVALLKPFFGDWILTFAAVYLIFVLVYTGLSGFRGVVATDRWQLLFIFLSIAALLTLSVTVIASGSVPIAEHAASLFGQWSAPLAFFIGIAFMNIPAPFSDAGTWQRVGAAASASSARRGLRGACALFVIIWSLLITCGIVLSGSDVVLSQWNPQEEPLIHGILVLLGTGSIIYLLILFALILGLFAAMISTADSLLIAATQVTMTGFQRHERLHANPIASLRVGRLLVVLLGVGAFAVFLVFHLIDLNIVQLVFAIYGAQLALFPTTAMALFNLKGYMLRPLRYFALASIIAGFATAWGTAIWGHISNTLDLQFYAPAFGLGAATLVLLAGMPIIIRQHRKELPN